MELEYVNVVLGIIASLLSIYSLLKSNKSEKRVKNLVKILNDSNIDLNINSGKKNKQVSAKDGSVGIAGNKNQVNFNKEHKNDR